MHHTPFSTGVAAPRAARRPRRFVAARALFITITALFAVVLPAAAAHAQLRVVNYNIAQLQGNLSNLTDVLAAMHDDDKPGFATPVGVFVFQEVLSGNVAALQSVINNAAPPGVSYSLGTYTNNNEDGFGGAQAMFFRTDLLSEVTSAHIDTYTGAGRRTDRWKLQLAGYTSPAASLYVYSSHLKSDTGAANQQERLDGAATIRSNADALGANQNIIFCGDYNLYDNGEPAYLWLLSAGNAQAFDPLGTGSWAGVGNALKHTQSPRATAGGGLIGGGLDDRFDFQLSTASLHDNLGLSLMNLPMVYRGLCNDGNHYNQSINSGNNNYYPLDIARSNALANDLFAASDHMPVVVDYQIPARMAGSFPPTFGRVIQGAAHTLSATITNTAPVDFALGGDVLDFTATGALALSGTQSGAVEPLGDFDTVTLALNTAAVGNVTARINLTSTSQGVEPVALTLNSTGSIVRHANASFSNTADVNDTTAKTAFDADTGAHLINVPVYNFGFNTSQALLDIDAVTSLSSPFAFAGGATIGIGSTPATLQFAFDTDGATPGTHLANVTINVSDENLPGAAAGTITLTLAININGGRTCEADTNSDGFVNVDDLIAVILAWGPCPVAPATCGADVNDDAQVNVDDLIGIILAWGTCP